MSATPGNAKKRATVLILNKLRLKLIIMSLVSAVLFFPVSSIAVHQNRVLFISSYHPGFPTFFQQVNGIKSVFKGNNILLDIEHMDTKRFPQKEQWIIFQSALSYKLNHTEPYDTVIVADDNALILAIQEQNRLFKGIPIVFMGINNIDRALDQNKNPQITGVVEAISLIETIELMIRLYPRVDRIVAIVDDTPSGQSDLETFYKTSKTFKSHEFSEISLADKTWSEFLKSLASIDDHSAVILLSAYKDKNNTTYTFEESLEKIRKATKLPIFHLWYHGIGEGLLGGKIISHFEQGKTAAEITQQILSGQPVSEREVILQSPNKYVFDYTELQRNKIRLSQLPVDSIILNEPDSFYKKNQKVIWAIAITILILSLSLLISIANILKRLRIEKELKKSEERFQLAMKAVSDGVWDWDIVSNKVFYSQGWAAMLSEEVVEPAYEFWVSKLHPDDKSIVLTSLQQHLDGQLDYWEKEHRLKTRTGYWKWVLGRGAVVAKSQEGQPLRMVGTMTDISDRKSSEIKLQQSERRAESILQANPNPVVVYDSNGYPKFINESFTTVFGWTLEEVQGGTIPFVPDEEKEITIAKITEIYKTGKPLQFLTKRYTKSNDVLDVTISAAVYKNVKGENTGMVVNIIDMTEQLKLEGQFRQAQKMESIGRLAGGVAHDFNNMLSIIFGNIEIALDEMDPSIPFFHNIKEVQKAAHRSADLTRQLLAFARKQMISPQVLDLNHTIEGMLKMLKRLIGEDIDLSWHPDESLGPVKIDPSQVDQMLANLCVNARDSIKDVGKITIETQNVHFDENYCKAHSGFRPGDYSLISISDTGCGMDNETIKNLFEPFFTTKDLGEGTGLGLATVYGIVKQNDGFINVYSEPGDGTSFKIYLPRQTDSVKQEAQKTIEQKILNGYETVLLVEDEKAILKTTQEMLHRMGYQVLTANSPDAAIHICMDFEYQIHLLITDVVMPSMNGRDLAEKILQIYPKIKVLYMSGYTANVIAHRGILDQDLNFINKPFSRQELSIKLREILDE